MWSIAIAMLGAAVSAFYFSALVPIEEQRHRELTSSVSTMNFLNYRASVIAYANANPASRGIIPDSSLAFPYGFVRDARWSNVINDESGKGIPYVHTTTSAEPYLLGELFLKGGGNLMIGTKVSGSELRSASGQSLSLTLPAGIPVGAVVFIGK